MIVSRGKRVKEVFFFINDFIILIILKPTMSSPY